MPRKITIIGVGNVGATIAYTLSLSDLASQLVLIDINKEKVLGEVMDIAQGASFRDPISIVAGDYEDARDSDIVIITSGVGRRPGQSRIELAQTNVNILKSITPRIVAAAPRALYLIVSNPVDIMTYVFAKISGLPENQVIGSGTILDTSRLRYALANHFHIAQKNINAYVFGEHGDTSFVPWSCTDISGCSLHDYENMVLQRGLIQTRMEPDTALEYVRRAGGEIISRKGATFYAVSVSVKMLCSAVSAAYDSILTVSSMMHGEYGIDDVCLSTLNLVGPHGIQGKVPLTLTPEEIGKLRRSADALHTVIRGLDL